MSILIWKLQNEPLLLCAKDWLDTLLPLYFGLFLKLALQLSDTSFCISHDSVFLWRQNQRFAIWIIMLDAIGLLHISWSFFKISCFYWNQLLFTAVVFFVFLGTKDAYFWHYSCWWWTTCQSTFWSCMYWFWFNIVILWRCISSLGSKFPIAVSMISNFFVVAISRQEHFIVL